MVKNLKFYRKTKGKFKLVIAALSTTLLLSGCADASRALYEEIPEEKVETEVTIDSEDSSLTGLEEYETPVVISGVKPFADVSNSKLVLSDVIFADNAYNDFVNYIDNYEVDYEYSNLYYLDEALAKHSNIKYSNTHYSKLSTINGSELYNLIKENNKEYKKANNSSLIQDVDDEELKSFCDLISEVINKYLNEHPNISEDRVKCILSDLKIFEQKGSMSNAYVTLDNRLIISPTMIEMIGLVNKENDVYDVLTHEVIHLLQKGCNCDISLNDDLVLNYGMGYRYDGLKVNSLENTWLYEASAEKCMCNYRDMELITYKNMIGYLESLSMINIMNDDFKVHDTEHLSFEHDIEKLYEFFDVTTEEDKREILNMMYSVEVMQNLPSDFIKTYEEEYGVKVDDDVKNSIRYNVKSSVCQTFNKLFYRNLANKLVNESIPLEDVFYLISAYETDLNNHILYANSDHYQYNEDLMVNYVNLQNYFFELLANSNNMTLTDVIDLYSNYTAKAYDQSGNVVNNYDLSWLGSDKIEYINERIENINLPSVNLSSAYEYFETNTKRIQ